MCEEIPALNGASRLTRRVEEIRALRPLAWPYEALFILSQVVLGCRLGHVELWLVGERGSPGPSLSLGGPRDELKTLQETLRSLSEARRGLQATVKRCKISETPFSAATHIGDASHAHVELGSLIS